ncbi:nucleoside-diphosphate-sugar epimerase [Variovorax boronicumulans]|uniref:UDP-glucose 4-epimerase family protein n=1 Tax=Variovorax boronicumulans TaxID=436515 RepID=UPI0024764A4A|nr:SDR family oxidoreductase [Variovorax boronicumulans]MDH6166710.1 nucleoside-diphosphate-sugar epimerase [Variovorax boronicumulans]
MRVLVTGATGFVGGALIRQLMERGSPGVSGEAVPAASFEIVAGVRQPSQGLPASIEQCTVGDLSSNTDWSEALRGADAVVHCAARVHVMKDTAEDPLSAFRSVNVEGTLNLARQAAAAGVRRFVFVSSIKVNGEATVLGRPFRADDSPAPQDAYGISKHEAEAGLRQLAIDSGMEVAIVRPPLVYGHGVKANFRAMMGAVARRLPLPLGGIEHNRRSMVALGNLVDLLVTCISHSAAANRTFLISDGEDLSTSQLLRRLGQAMGRPARLVPVPVSWIELGAALLGRRSVAQRLCGSLQVDISDTRQRLGWAPPLSVDEGLKRAAEGYLNEASV